MIPYIHLGFFDLPTFGLMMAAAFVVSFFALDAEMKRRRMPGDSSLVISVIAIAGLIGAKLWHVIESQHQLMTDPWGQILSRTGFAWFGGFVAGLLTLIYFARRYNIPVLLMLDAASPAGAIGYAVRRIGCLVSGDGDYGIPTNLPGGRAFPNGRVRTPPGLRVHPTPIYEFIANVLIFWYLWRLGSKAIRGPRPQGQVVAEFLILSGLSRFLVEFIRINPKIFLGMSNAQIAALGTVIAGAVLLVVVKSRFRALKGEHRILQHFEQRGDVLQPEYHRATSECPHPERWSMYDSMTAEVEVLEFLRCLVTTIKPEMIVETGTFMGISTLWLAEGLKRNGLGKIITCEYDPVVFEKAKERFESSSLSNWIDYRNESSLQTKVEGKIDLLFSDSDPPLREQEVRRFLPQMNPTGLILMHDASSHLATVREAARRLEAEGLISVVLMPTPRGLVVAQKRAGRS